jgi:hypothetical protein
VSAAVDREKFLGSGGPFDRRILLAEDYRNRQCQINAANKQNKPSPQLMYWNMKQAANTRPSVRHSCLSYLEHAQFMTRCHRKRSDNDKVFARK